MKANDIQNKARTSVRKTWGDMSPVTKRLESKKNYSRKPRNNKGYDE